MSQEPLLVELESILKSGDLSPLNLRPISHLVAASIHQDDAHTLKRFQERVSDTDSAYLQSLSDLIERYLSYPRIQRVGSKVKSAMLRPKVRATFQRMAQGGSEALSTSGLTYLEAQMAEWLGIIRVYTVGEELQISTSLTCPPGLLFQED